MWIRIEDEEAESLLNFIETGNIGGIESNRRLKNVANNIRSRRENQYSDLWKAFLAGADRIYGKEGSIEIDDDAVVSLGDDPGAYVMGWLWVYADQVGPVLESDELKA